MSEERDGLDRRQFMAALGGAVGALGALGVSCGKASDSTGESGERPSVKQPKFLDHAVDGAPLKAGLVGCGGRGTGAAENFLNAGLGLRITALGDVFEDRLNGCRDRLLKRGQEIPQSSCFIGFDAYKRVIDSGVDIVLLATPPHFRAEQFAACVAARKHVFMEKPVAVDPVGIRSIIASARKGAAIGLCCGTGTQRRHQRDYVTTFEHIRSGAVGRIVAANCYWNQPQLWHRNRQDGWTDMEYMIRDWVNWCWLSGDHIVEQHVHNLDVIHWFTGKLPVKAVGFGARHRRRTGDQYDMFSIDYVYDDRTHAHSMCRQIDGCANNVSEFIMGEKGSSNCRNKIFDGKGKLAWEYRYPIDEHGKPTGRVAVSPYDQEHIDLVTAIRSGTPHNEAERTALSTLIAIMGRVSAYTGREVTWDEMLQSELRLGPATYELGPLDITAEAPIPGSA